MTQGPETGIAVRTLVAAGFEIENCVRHPYHIELPCRRPDLFGIEIPYLVAIFETDVPETEEVHRISADATRSGRIPIIVSRKAGPTSLGWSEVLDSLGGAVPNWRALGPSYRAFVLTTAKNELPRDTGGEAWQHFEDAVADGFEFLLGARVLRLGGKRRGKKVSDLVALMPDQVTLVVDTKAYSSPFDTSSGNLRALEDYTVKQIERQRGSFAVGGAVLVANSFAQDTGGLHRNAGDFLAVTRVPLTFVTAETLVEAVELVSKQPVIRAGVQWRRLFCRGGLLAVGLVRTEIEDAMSERKAR